MSWSLNVTLKKDAIGDLDGIAESPVSTSDVQEAQVAKAKAVAKEMANEVVRDGYDVGISIVGHAEPPDGSGASTLYVSVGEVRPGAASA